MQIKDFLQSCKDAGMTEGFVAAQLWDEYILNVWSEELSGELQDKCGKILEIRIFNRNGERRLFRADLTGADFLERELKDSDDQRDFFDEVQYIDIDQKASAGHKEKGDLVKTTGGGAFCLPLHSIKDVKVRIRYYLGRYKETGQARVEDWRMVELIEGGEM